MPTKSTRSAPAQIHFYLTEEDWRRLSDRARLEERGYARRDVSAHEMARRFVLAGLDGEVRLPPALLEEVRALAQGEESASEVLERVVRIGVGRARTLAAQREKA